MVGLAGSTTGIVHADMTLTRSKVKVKVTGLLNFRQLAKLGMLAAMTVSPLSGLYVIFFFLTASATSSFHHHVPLCCFHHYLFQLIIFFTSLFLLEFSYTYSWLELLMLSFCWLNCMSITNSLCFGTHSSFGMTLTLWTLTLLPCLTII